jgi:hypothetical protein
MTDLTSSSAKVSRQLRRSAPVMVPEVQIREPEEQSPLGKRGRRSLLLISRRIGYEFYLHSLSNSKSAKKSPVTLHVEANATE